MVNGFGGAEFNFGSGCVQTWKLSDSMGCHCQMLFEISLNICLVAASPVLSKEECQTMLPFLVLS